MHRITSQDAMQADKVTDKSTRGYEGTSELFPSGASADTRSTKGTSESVMSVTPKERLRQFIAFRELTQRKFAHKAQISAGVLRGGGHTLSMTSVRKIGNAFPELNIGWLLTGEGEMLKSDFLGLFPGAPTVPLLSIASADCPLGDFIATAERSRCERIITPIPRAEVAVSIKDSSMEPDFPAGCVVYARQIDPQKFLPWGRSYLIDTSNGLLFRLLGPGSDSESVRALAINTDPTYASIDIKKEDIRGLYLVMASLTLC